MVEIEIDELRCNMCGMCIEICMEKVLSFEDGKLSPINIYSCTACLACELGCPHMAIKIIQKA